MGPERGQQQGGLDRSTGGRWCRKHLEKALRLLVNDGVVAMPTDTLYGLAADVFSVTALRRIFSIKGRPPDLALPVLLGDWGQLEVVAQPLPDAAVRLAQRFWPGPLTLVLRRAYRVPDLLTGGGDTVAVRMPGHWVPLALAQDLGHPITGSSANRSGLADLMTLEALERELGPVVDYVFPLGPAPAGTASTVVDVTGATPRLVREGAVPFAEVLAAWG